jgi:spore germination protein GerM
VTRRAVLTVVAALALLGACGIAEDGEPHAIAPENLPPGLLDPNPGSSTTLPESAGTRTITVYFLETVDDRERLTPIEREVPEDAASQPGGRLAALFAAPTEAEAEENLTSSIPRETTLLSAVEGDDEDELVIDVSSALFSIVGEELAKAFAQNVYTVTAPDAGGYRNVRFLLDGEPTFAFDGEGVVREGAVSRADYFALAPES